MHTAVYDGEHIFTDNQQGREPSRIPTPVLLLIGHHRQAVKYSTPAANSGWSFSPGTFLNVPLL